MKHFMDAVFYCFKRYGIYGKAYISQQPRNGLKVLWEVDLLYRRYNKLVDVSS